MGAIIKATSMTIGNGNDSIIDMCAEAVKDCINKSGVDKRDISLLINACINRDKNIVEPAIAALIQNKARLNLNPNNRLLYEKKGTLSFDVINGACGFYSAAQIINSFFRCGTIEKAIIVTGDVHPSGKIVPDFPFTHSGSAMLLERSNDERGFKKFIFETSKGDYLGMTQLCNPAIHGNNARNVITIDIADDYLSRLKNFILDTINKYVDKGIIDLDKFNHLIAPTISMNFGKEIADSIGFKNNLIMNSYDKYGDTNTSSPIIEYHLAVEKGIIKSGDQILFIGGSGGLSFACGFYEV